ncbi:hypothetical protein OH491_19375 [Termitidicoccus mucosus]|uniref:Uncharacterized protein n=1 Tax=Termitidicoccus mucosus TaxID=1184151 RepID=A0A178IG18_9BACT|nr:hypothetical protein AW736_09295 [Opitutaceae bacterium TSB47]
MLGTSAVRSRGDPREFAADIKRWPVNPAASRLFARDSLAPFGFLFREPFYDSLMGYLNEIS